MMKMRTWGGVLFGTALAIGTAFAVLPIEALASAWTCESNCADNVHDHPVTVESGQEITEGTFKQKVTVNDGGKISGGTFNSDIDVHSGGEISNVTDTSRYGLISVYSGGKITGGTFIKNVELAGGTITGGTFKNVNTCVNLGTIKGGTFEGFQYNKGSIEGGTFKVSVTNYGSITGGTFEQGIDNQTGGTVSLPSSTPAASESTETSAPVHKHSFEWTVTKEPTGSENGLEEYKCKGCGAVEASQPISMYMFRVKELYGLVKDAPKGGAVAYDSGNLATISDYILAKMAERNDVAVTVSFTYNGETHSITFPAGTDYTAVLSDEDIMYGFYGVAAKLGLTVE